MRVDLENSPSARVLMLAAAFVIVVAGMKASEAIVVPFIMSVFIAVICGPPLFWMQRRGVPTGVALLVVVAFVVLGGLLMGVLVGSSADEFSSNLPLYQERLRDQTAAVVAWLNGFGISVPAQTMRDYFDPGKAMKLAGQVLTSFTGILTNAFLILLTVVFILLEASSFPRKLGSVLDDPETSLKGFQRFTETVKRYMAIKTGISLATGALVTIWLFVMGVDYPLLWGLLAFLLNYVPNIGSIIAAVPAVLLALVQLGFGSAAVIMAGLMVINIVMGSVIEPRFMGRGLGLSTLVVFMSLVFWGWVLGPMGMLLSVPLTMTVKIAFDSGDDTRWIATLLGSEGKHHDAPTEQIAANTKREETLESDV